MLEKFFRVVDRVGPNPQFFRAIAVLLGLGFVMAKMPWVNHAVGQSIGIADLRHSVIFEQIASEKNDVLIVRAINVGQKKAENIVVSIRGKSRENLFKDLNIDSDEVYEVLSSDLTRQEIIIQLPRLAPGAEFTCRVDGWFNRPESIKVSIVSDQGKSLSMDLPALNAQMNSYTRALENLYTKTFSLLRERLSPLSHTIQIRDYLRKQIGGFSSLERELIGEDFRTLFIAWFIFTLIIGLFFPRLIVVLIPFTFASLFLFLDSKVALGLILAPYLLPTAIYVFFESCINNKDNGQEESSCFSITLGSIGMFISPFLFMKTPLVSAKWLSIPAFYVIIWFLVIISYIIPSSKQPLSSQALYPPFEQNLTVYSKLDLEDLKSLDGKVQTIINYLEYFEKKMRGQDMQIQRLQGKVASLYQIFSGDGEREKEDGNL